MRVLKGRTRRKLGRIIWWTAATALATSSTPATSQERWCVQPADFQAVALVILPRALGRVADRCAATLPPDAGLLTRDGARWSELDASAAAVQVAADEAATRLVGEMPDLMRESDGTAVTALALLEQMTTRDLVAGIKEKDCATASEVFDALAPLPPENIVRLVALMVSGDSSGSLLCQPGESSAPPPVFRTVPRPVPPRARRDASDPLLEATTPAPPPSPPAARRLPQ